MDDRQLADAAIHDISRDSRPVNVMEPNGPTARVLGVPVIEGATPQRWQGFVDDEDTCADADRCLFMLGPARVYVSGGSAVMINRIDLGDRLAYDFMVYSWAMEMLLTQRRRFTLHASLVTSPQGCTVAIAGDSGAGKSTTAAALVARGWTLACDDVAEIDLRGELPLIVPHERPVHLSDRAIKLLGADPSIGRLLPGRTKRTVQIDADLSRRPLGLIVQLRTSPGKISTAEVSAADATAVLAAHGESSGVTQAPELRADYFGWLTKLAGATPVVDLTRPPEDESLEEVCDALDRLANRL
ncbi:MAG: hypothetical protein KAZ48_08285 [Candidatus Nanopelagicales bacterium]|nr:hypothetical protein [Candidatus Nanopelagicales bacterium]